MARTHFEELFTGQEGDPDKKPKRRDFFFVNSLMQGWSGYVGGSGTSCVDELHHKGARKLMLRFIEEARHQYTAHDWALVELCVLEYVNEKLGPAIKNRYKRYVEKHTHH